MWVASKIALRNTIEQDLSILYSIQKEQEGYEMAVVIPREEVEFFRHWRENILSNSEVVIRTVEVDGEVAGDVTSFVRNGRRLVGYWFAKKYWGQGIATAAVTDFLASHETRRPLSAFVAVSNTASYRVLQRCGFIQIGDSAKADDGVDEYRLDLLH
jgi:RimJ/RimL family protein N-acetyltransferase